MNLKTITLIALICWAVLALFTIYEFFTSFGYGSGYYSFKSLVELAAEASFIAFLFFLYSKQKPQTEVPHA